MPAQVEASPRRSVIVVHQEMVAAGAGAGVGIRGVTLEDIACLRLGVTGVC